MTNDQIASKVEGVISIVTDGTGYLNPEQSNKFLDLMIDVSTILPMARVVRMNAPKRKIEKVGFGSRVLHGGPGQATPLDASKRATPDFGIVELITKELMGEYWIPYDVLEDNIERGNFEDTLMRLFVERVGLDMEELFLLGDTDNTGDDLLSVTDGILTLVSPSKVIDCSAYTNVDKSLFKAGIQNMSTKYLRARNLLRFFTSHHAETEYRDSLADRSTALGDEKTTGFTPTKSFGVPVIPAALMPENKVLLTDPQNLILGVQRQIMIETDRDIRRRVLVVVCTMRVDIQIERSDACVVMENFTDSGLPTTSTTTTTTTAP